EFKDRMGMARPQFGTTRTQWAVFADTCGKGTLGDTLRFMKGRGLRVYDGNGAVARAVGNGEGHIGVCESDDVVAGKREGWPVEMALLKCSMPGSKEIWRIDPHWAEVQCQALTGTMLIPNTISRVRGGPNAKDAGALVDFLLSKPTQKLMAESESRNLP